MNYLLKMKNYIDEHRIESKKSALKTTMTIQASELNAGGPIKPHFGISEILYTGR